MTRNGEDAQDQRHEPQTTSKDDMYQIPSMVQTAQQTEDVQQADTITSSGMDDHLHDLSFLSFFLGYMKGLTSTNENKANGDGTTSSGCPSPKCCFPKRRSMVIPRRQDSTTPTTVNLTSMHPGVEAAPAIQPPPTATLPLVHPSWKKRHTSH